MLSRCRRGEAGALGREPGGEGEELGLRGEYGEGEHCWRCDFHDWLCIGMFIGRELAAVLISDDLVVLKSLAHPTSSPRAHAKHLTRSIFRGAGSGTIDPMYRQDGAASQQPIKAQCYARNANPAPEVHQIR